MRSIAYDLSTLKPCVATPQLQAPSSADLCSELNGAAVESGLKSEAQQPLQWTKVEG
jgi:hypothetical protein